MKVFFLGALLAATAFPALAERSKTEVITDRMTVETE